MALFGKGGKDAAKGNRQKDAGPVPVVGRTAYCRICDDYRQFSKCWMRQRPVTQCTGCGAALDNAAELYKKFQPACPRCGEFLEQPGFEYGLCDGCGSKFELVAGTKPGLLPNRKQREQMDTFGKARSPD